MDRRDLFRFGGIAAVTAGFMLASREAEAASPFLWSGAGSYSSGPTNILTTELNSLASSAGNTLSTLGAAFQNTGAWVYADVEFVPGGTFSPTAGGFLELWLLRSIDGGSNYDYGNASAAPGRPADVIIPVAGGTTITPRSQLPGLVMPPSFFKALVRNQTGATLPASGNLIRYSLYTEQY